MADSFDEDSFGKDTFGKESERVVHRGGVVTVTEAVFRAPDGARFEREIVRHPGAVSVVPLIDDATVLLLRQYRAAVDAELLEIPAGKRDVPGEAPDLTAQRELVEEVGRRAGRLEELARFHNSPGFTDEHSIVYRGRDLHEEPRAPQGVEEQHMSIQEVAMADVEDMITAGLIVDAKTIIGLLLAGRRVGG